MEPRPLNALGECSTTELYSKPLLLFYFETWCHSTGPGNSLYIPVCSQIRKSRASDSCMLSLQLGLGVLATAIRQEKSIKSRQITKEETKMLLFFSWAKDTIIQTNRCRKPPSLTPWVWRHLPLQHWGDQGKRIWFDTSLGCTLSPCAAWVAHIKRSW